MMYISSARFADCCSIIDLATRIEVLRPDGKRPAKLPESQ